MSPGEFAALIVDRCGPRDAREILAAADSYAAWCIERYARPRAAIDEPAGRLGALSEGRKLLAHRELTGTGER